MNSKTKGLLEIHTAVFLFGVSSLFPKLISLPPVIIALGRVFIAAAALKAFLSYSSKSIRLNKTQDYFVFTLSGALYALNAIAFYEAIQLSTVAIGVVSSGVFPIFATLLEPIYFKEQLRAKDVLLALITFGGLTLIVPKFDIHHGTTQGICWGVTAGFVFANLSILNRKYVQTYSSFVMVFYQNLFAGILLLPALFLVKFTVHVHHLFLLIVLGIFFTAGSHSLFVKGMRALKAQTASIITNLEPVYGTLLALIFLREIPNWRVLIGGAIIIAVTFYVSLEAKRSVGKT